MFFTTSNDENVLPAHPSPPQLHQTLTLENKKCFITMVENDISFLKVFIAMILNEGEHYFAYLLAIQTSFSLIFLFLSFVDFFPTTLSFL